MNDLRQLVSDERIQEKMEQYDRLDPAVKRKLRTTKRQVRNILSQYYSAVDERREYSLAELGKPYTLKSRTVRTLLSKLELSSLKKRGRPKKIHAAAYLDVYIEQGLHLREMQDTLAQQGVVITREGIRQCMTQEQHMYWKGRVADREKREKEESQEIRTSRATLLFCLEQRVLQQADEVDTIVLRTLEKHRIRSESVPLYYLICRAYLRVAAQGYTPTLPRIQREIGTAQKIEQSGISRYLHMMELPLQTQRYRHLSKELISGLEKVAAGPLANNDIAYFTGVDRETVRTRCGKRPSERLLFGTRKNPLSYSLASKIYEAEDIGFSAAEIAELYATQERIVAYALKNRTDIAPLIINALQTLFPSEKRETPYR